MSIRARKKTKSDEKTKLPRKNSPSHEFIEELLYYAYFTDLTNKDISQILHKDAGTISKILNSIEDEYVIKLVKIPRRKLQEKTLEDSLRLRYVEIVSKGQGKNSEHLGLAAAEYTRGLIEKEFKDKDEINIGVSCGEAIRFAVKRLVEELMDHHVCLKGKTVNIYPSALIGGNKFTNISPAFTATQLAHKMMELPEDIRPTINCYHSILPASINFKDTPLSEVDALRKHCGYKTILPDPVNTLDILLTGIGLTSDPEYIAACRQSGLPIHVDEIPQHTPEINFTPIDAKGVIPSYRNYIEGIQLEQMQEMAKDKSKYVIALMGGEIKKVASLIAFANPHFNVLFTDAFVADHWLAINKENTEPEKVV